MFNLRLQFILNFFLLVVSIITLSGCGTTGPVDQDWKPVAEKDLSKYALVFVLPDYAGIRSIDGEPKARLDAFRKLAYFLPGKHTVETYNPGYVFHTFTVKAGFQYRISSAGTIYATSINTSPLISYELKSSGLDIPDSRVIKPSGDAHWHEKAPAFLYLEDAPKPFSGEMPQ